MKRRRFIAISGTCAVTLLAGCSDNDDSPTPTETDTNPNPNPDTETPDSETPTDGEPSNDDVPSNMVEISEFAFDNHELNVRERPYEIIVEASGARSSQMMTFKFNGDEKSLFTVESNRPDGQSTFERYSAFGINYNRTNPPDGEITYSKEYVQDETSVYIYSGLDQIDQLTSVGVEVSNPTDQGDGVYQYEFVSHPDYETVSGYIKLDVERGVFTELSFEGRNSDESYSLQMDWTFEGQSVDAPAWVQDMDDETPTNSS